MPDNVNQDKIMSDPDYRVLYMKYIGTLSLLGRLAELSEPAELKEAELEACRSDARGFLAPDIDIIDAGRGFFVDVL